MSITNFLTRLAGNYIQAKLLGGDPSAADVLKYTALQQGIGALTGGADGSSALNLFGKKEAAGDKGFGQADMAQAIAGAVDKKMSADNAVPAALAKNRVTAESLIRPQSISPFKQADNTLGYSKFLVDAGILGGDSKLANMLNSPVGEALATALISGIGSKLFDQEEEVGPQPGPFGGVEGYTRLNIPRKMAGGGIIDGQYFPRRNGGIMPHEGSGQKDDVPAMLMAGEFVLTKDAVKGLGNGDSRKGIEKAYSMMRSLENKANKYVN
jgi:hypothetical protein